MISFLYVLGFSSTYHKIAWECDSLFRIYSKRDTISSQQVTGVALNYYEKIYLLGVSAECHGVMGKNTNKQLLPGIILNPLMFFKTFLLWLEAFVFLDLTSMSFKSEAGK